jgi:NAD(P)-dependent dehydrogenase (short-subunit alcohol dehydrogenase family)
MQSFTKFAGLDGASVLVTGGATGIGSAIVENFVCQGSRVVFFDTTQSPENRDPRPRRTSTSRLRNLVALMSIAPREF